MRNPSIFCTQHHHSQLLALAFAALLAGPAHAELVAFDLVGSEDGNLDSFVNPFDGAFSSPGDGFQVYQRFVSPSIPFAVLDDSLSIFSADSLGIITEGNTDTFFGVTDTLNNDNPTDDVQATWEFDVSGASPLEIFIDMAAMGDFESSDTFVWEVALDGGPFTPVFTSSVDEAGSQTYVLEGGAAFTLDDPMLVNGTLLDNNLQPIFATIPGTGDVLTLRLVANTNGGSEAFAFQNIRITSGEDGSEPPDGPQPTALTIPEIQGAGHVSPYNGELIVTDGLVTAVAFNGFYLQDPEGDGDVNTSDGIFVFSRASVNPGEMVSVTGSVSEFIPGGAATGNLSITQIGGNVEVTVNGAAPGLVSPVIIGRGGRVPPAVFVISEDEIDPPINLQIPADAASNRFNPEEDGIDFYESLEGMLVTIEDPVAVSATRTFTPFSSEFFVLANNGADVAPHDARNRRGGIDLQPDPDNRGDQNPERVQIQLDGTLYPASVPAVTVGDRLADVTGVVGYSFGNFEVNAIEPLTVVPGKLAEERSRLRKLPFAATLASYNVLNLSPDEGDANQRATLARHIVHNLRSPDVVALQEIQDNSGEIDDGTIDASETLAVLIAAIEAAGGPAYDAFDVAPADGASGGIPGGNIRNAYLYNPERVSLEGFESLTPGVLAGYGVSNPAAFAGTRDPLLATFSFRGTRFTVINNHLTSRFGSSPVFGGPQPFVQAGEAEREAQVLALNEVVRARLVDDGNARIVVLGDLNTFEFTNDIAEILPGTGRDRVLYNLIDRLRDDKVYTFIFDGNSQVLDHALVTKRALLTQLDIVHVNVDFPRVDDTLGSDHEPLLLRLFLPRGRDDDDDH